MTTMPGRVTYMSARSAAKCSPVAIRNSARVGCPSVAYAVSGDSATQSAWKLHPDSKGQAFRSTNGKAGGESWAAAAPAPPARTSRATSGRQRARRARDSRAAADVGSSPSSDVTRGSRERCRVRTFSDRHPAHQTEPASEHVEERPRGEAGRVPRARVGEPADRLVGRGRAHEGEGAAAVEDTAELDAAGVAELDERVRRRGGVARGALHHRQPARAVEHDGRRRESIDEVAEAARRVRPPHGAPPVRVLLDQAPEPGPAGGAIDDLRAAPVGRGPPADHEALRAKPVKARDVGLPVRLAPAEIVVGGGDADVEHRHATASPARGTTRPMTKSASGAARSSATRADSAPRVSPAAEIRFGTRAR